MGPTNRNASAYHVRVFLSATILVSEQTLRGHTPRGYAVCYASGTRFPRVKRLVVEVVGKFRMDDNQTIEQLRQKIGEIEPSLLREDPLNRKEWPNQHEARLADLARAAGFIPSKRGWPDFILWGEDDEAIVVEVKPPGAAITPEQARVMRFLARHGIPVFTFSDDALVPVDPSPVSENHPGRRIRSSERTRGDEA